MVFLLTEKDCISGSLYSEGELFQQIKSDRVLHRVLPGNFTVRLVANTTTNWPCSRLMSR